MEESVSASAPRRVMGGVTVSVDGDATRESTYAHFSSTSLPFVRHHFKTARGALVERSSQVFEDGVAPARSNTMTCASFIDMEGSVHMCSLDGVVTEFVIAYRDTEYVLDDYLGCTKPCVPDYVLMKKAALDVFRDMDDQARAATKTADLAVVPLRACSTIPMLDKRTQWMKDHCRFEGPRSVLILFQGEMRRPGCFK